MWGSVFPGQGSQHIGMGRFLFDNFKEAKEKFEEASDHLKLDFKKLCFTGDEAELQLTKNTQPALLLTSTVTYEVVHNITGYNSKVSAGHSIGEYAALVTSGATGFLDALRAVRIRGEAMQEAVPVGEGAMCAVMGMNEQQVRELCQWVEKKSGITPLEPANFNAPGQIVISGNAKAVQWLQDNFSKDALSDPPSRAKFIPLKVSAPFHCSLMKPAEEKMRGVLTNIQFVDIKSSIVQNFTALEVSDGATLRENIIRQISAPVLWTQCVEKLRELGANRLVEFGSGKVLSGLIKKIDSEGLQTFNLNSLEELKNLEAEFKKEL